MVSENVEHSQEARDKEPSSPMSRVVVESKQHSHNLFRHMIQENERQLMALERSHYLVDQTKVKEKVRI